MPARLSIVARRKLVLEASRGLLGTRAGAYSVGEPGLSLGPPGRIPDDGDADAATAEYAVARKAADCRESGEAVTPSHIGVVACSAEGAALCYRTICLEAIPRLGPHDHPRITLSAIPMARHMECIRRNEWSGVADLLLDGATEVARAGAAFALCPDNTVHQAFPELLPRSPLPWLHIAEVVADEAERRGFRRLGVLGTRYLMEGPVYRETLAGRNIEMRLPAEAGREAVDRAIFEELVNAVFSDGTRRMFLEEIAKLREQGCDAAVLGCTEIPLIVRPEDSPLPTLDSTRLLARAALDRSLAGEAAAGPAPAPRRPSR